MLFGIPRAAVGILAFAAALAIILSPGRRARLIAPFVGAFAAIEAVRLIALQLFVYKAICPYCMVADTSAVVMCIALGLEAWARPRAALRRAFALRLAPAGAVLAIVGPIAFAAAKPGPRLEIAPVPASADGRMVLREFVDLQCPFCRATHVALKKALEKRPDVVVERHHVPFPQHEHALAAAVAACCAGEQAPKSASSMPSSPIRHRPILRSVARSSPASPSTVRNSRPA